MSLDPHFDLIAIGAGLAGLVAAVRAAELGLRVAVLEQGVSDSYPCSSRYAGGIFHVAYHDICLAPAELAAAIRSATGDGADPALAEGVATDAGRAVEWLAAQGARFTRGSPIDWHGFVLDPPRAAVAGPDWRGRGPDRLLDTLRRRLEERQGRLFLGTRAGALALRAGLCTGVRAHVGGAERTMSAGAVVIADGGFPADAELFRTHIGPAPERVLQRNGGSAQGDGLRMAEAAGAALVGLDRFYGHLLARAAMTEAALSPYPQIDAVAAAAIIVDSSGMRFLDEGQGGIAMANALARRDDPLCATIVCDTPIWESAGRAAQIPPNPELERAGGTLHRAATIAGLASLAGIDGAALALTVAAYNDAVRAGRLDRLSPARRWRGAPPLPIATPPYIAIPICPAITNTMGGIAIDGDGRVRHRDGHAIPGLYAAGGATGGLEGGGETGGYVGGLIKATVFGLRAAEHAAGKAR